MDELEDPPDERGPLTGERELRPEDRGASSAGDGLALAGRRRLRA
ncbi:MAG TPA: hypothetical protein VIJ50_12420 [Solirubrobacteraceae bacterium]